MTKKIAVTRWRESALRNLTVARGMFDLGHYDWALFIGQLALEKLLKGLYTKKANASPPYIHDLAKLAVLSGLKMTAFKPDTTTSNTNSTR